MNTGDPLSAVVPPEGWRFEGTRGSWSGVNLHTWLHEASSTAAVIAAGPESLSHAQRLIDGMEVPVAYYQGTKCLVLYDVVGLMGQYGLVVGRPPIPPAPSAPPLVPQEEPEG